MKTVLSFFAITFLFGCLPAKQVAPVTQQTFTFDYVPKTTTKSGSASMVLAFIKPNYANDFTAGGTELFKRFKDALASDIEELIIGKGFSIKGPYAEFDEMVFDDKKRTDVAIRIEIAPQFTAVEGGWNEHLSLLGANYTTYSYAGKASLVGKINITGIEPLTNEKIWSKSVSIPNIENIDIRTSTRYSRRLEGTEIFRDPGIYNAMGKALQDQYTGIMDKISAHFSAEEFNSLKLQIKELKSKKGF